MQWFFDNPMRFIVLPAGLVSLFFPNLIRNFLFEIYKLNGSKGKFVVDDERKGPYDKKGQLGYVRLVGIALQISLLFT